MPQSVFISYSQADKDTAERVCAVLEARGLSCWNAPRNILPGTDWGASILDAINDARVMVLVYSAASNHSHQVRREVERAVAKGVAIIPLRVESVPLGKTLEYFLATAHWLDAFTPPLEAHIMRLADAVRAFVDAPDRDTTGPILAMKGLSHPPLPSAPAPATETLPVGRPGPARAASLPPPVPVAKADPAPAKKGPPFEAPTGAKKGRFGKSVILGIAAAFVALLYFSASGGGPEITGITFPPAIPVGPQAITGSIEFKAGKSDILGARFVVVEATSFSPFDVRAAVAGQREGRFNFALYSVVPQRVTLEARLVDATGKLSKPHRFSFEAKRGANPFDFKVAAPPFKVRVP